MLGAGLSACSVIENGEAARLCRGLLPALNRADATIDLRTIATSRGGSEVRIAYETRAGAEPARNHTLACQFATATPPRLVALTTEQGPISPARLYVLERWWIEGGLAALGDPAPVANLTDAPKLPRPLAIALQQTLAALPNIAIYGLIAASYSLVYGLIGRINLAFGELALLAGYGAFLGFSLLSGGLGALAAAAIAVIVAVYSAVVHGWAAGRTVFAPLIEARGQHVLVASFGLLIATEEYMRLTQGAGVRWMSPLLNSPVAVARSENFPVTLTPMAVIVTAVAACAALSALALMRWSRFGRAWRAYADDPLAAALFGIDRMRLLLLTFALASALAGLGGAATTIYYGGVGHAGGLTLGLKALLAAVIGGIGSVPGAFAGALLLGGLEAAWSAVLPIEYRDPFIYAALATLLVARPGGLLGFGELVPRRL